MIEVPNPIAYSISLQHYALISEEKTRFVPIYSALKMRKR
jgi:hypothetical protein